MRYAHYPTANEWGQYPTHDHLMLNSNVECTCRDEASPWQARSMRTFMDGDGTKSRAEEGNGISPVDFCVWDV